MRKSLPVNTSLFIVLITVGILIFLSACTSDTSEGIKLISENSEFSRNSISVVAGDEVTIIFENRDNLPHNFAVYQSDEAKQRIFIGEIITGPETITYTFTAPYDPNTYFFRCDVHPETMRGTLRVYGTSS